ncbi:MAG TPA: LysR family transcriptional regulator [Candidatus Dormibacteraeota bacterium]|nr:LysR family transcriptional regulator [Candidatus Dormibacteraeota bacterium]
MQEATLRQLRIFATVVEQGGIGAAARALDLTQPSISTHVRRLECTVGRPLLDRRRGRRAETTASGRILYDFARQVVEGTEDLRRLFARFGAGEWGTVVAGVQRSLAHTMLAPILVEFAQRWPQVDLSVHTGTLSRIRELLLAGVVSLAVVVTEGDLPDLESIFLHAEPLVLIASPRHHLAERSSLRPRDLCDSAFVTALRSSSHYQTVQRLLARAGIIGHPIAMEAEDSTTIRGIVRAGFGVAALLWSSVKEDVERGHLVVLDLAVPLPSMEVRLAYLPGRSLTPAERNLRDLLLKRLGQMDANPGRQGPVRGRPS